MVALGGYGHYATPGLPANCNLSDVVEWLGSQVGGQFCKLAAYRAIEVATVTDWQALEKHESMPLFELALKKLMFFVLSLPFAECQWFSLKKQSTKIKSLLAECGIAPLHHNFLCCAACFVFAGLSIRPVWLSEP